MKKIIILAILFVSIFLYACSPKIEQTITITFETNGGSLIDDIVIDQSLEFVLPNDPIKEGYEFVGWYLDNDTFEVEFIDNIIDTNITLYAKWIEEGIVYDLAIFFESNGGSIVDPIVKDEGEDISQPIEPTREGYEFAGWYSDIDLTSIYEFNIMPSESITLYADWGTIGLEYELINDDTEYSVSKGMASQLTEIQIPNRKEGRLVTNIAPYGFYNCSNVTKILIPSSVNEIGEFAFHSCIELTELIIPIFVEIIGEGIVFDTPNLAVIYVETLTRPNDWHLLWNNTLKPVFWGYLISTDSKPTISIFPTSEYLVIGRTTQIIPTVANTRNEAIIWTSSNPNVAIVDILGVVTGVSLGEAIITATSVADATVSETVEIHVTMEGSGSLRVFSTKTVLAITDIEEQLTIRNSSGTELSRTDCTFTSSDSNIVTISSNGNIQAHSEGTVIVTVLHPSGGGVIKLTVVS